MITQGDCIVYSLKDLTEATYNRVTELFVQEAARCQSENAGLLHAGVAALDRLRNEAAAAQWHPINVERLAYHAGVLYGRLIGETQARLNR